LQDQLYKQGLCNVDAGPLIVGLDTRRSDQ